MELVTFVSQSSDSVVKVSIRSEFSLSTSVGDLTNGEFLKAYFLNEFFMELYFVNLFLLEVVWLLLLDSSTHNLKVIVSLLSALVQSKGILMCLPVLRKVGCVGSTSTKLMRMLKSLGIIVPWELTAEVT